MRNILLCIVSDIEDYKILDKQIEYIKTDLESQHYNIVKTYIAKYIPEGFTSTDDDEINYIIQNFPEIKEIKFVTIRYDTNYSYPKIKVL